MNTQPLTQLEMTEPEIALAERIASWLGYEQTAYTSTSALWGLFCLPENPATWKDRPQALRGGCIVKTAELGLMFVQTVEDLGVEEFIVTERIIARRQGKAVAR